jgi:hypothetical protein
MRFSPRAQPAMTTGTVNRVSRIIIKHFDTHTHTHTHTRRALEHVGVGKRRERHICCSSESHHAGTNNTTGNISSISHPRTRAFLLLHADLPALVCVSCCRPFRYNIYGTFRQRFKANPRRVCNVLSTLCCIAASSTCRCAGQICPTREKPRTR